MIGFVSPERQAVIRFSIDGSLGEIEIESIVDTGFNGFVSLNPTIIAQLSLSQSDTFLVELANGKVIETKIYRAHVLWNDQRQAVEVMEMAGSNVIGMRLLENHEMHIEVRDGGIVQINPLQN